MFQRLLRKVRNKSPTPLSENPGLDIMHFFDTLEELEDSVGTNSMANSYYSMTNSYPSLQPFEDVRENVDGKE